MTEREHTDSARDARDAREADALDEAVLLMIRKINRLHPMALADVHARLSDGARDALNRAEMRAALRRDTRGPLTEWPSRWTDAEDLDAA